MAGMRSAVADLALLARERLESSTTGVHPEEDVNQLHMILKSHGHQGVVRMPSGQQPDICTAIIDLKHLVGSNPSKRQPFPGTRKPGRGSNGCTGRSRCERTTERTRERDQLYEFGTLNVLRPIGDRLFLERLPCHSNVPGSVVRNSINLAEWRGSALWPLPCHSHGTRTQILDNTKPDDVDVTATCSLDLVVARTIYARSTLQVVMHEMSLEIEGVLHDLVKFASRQSQQQSQWMMSAKTPFHITHWRSQALPIGPADHQFPNMNMAQYQTVSHIRWTRHQ